MKEANPYVIAINSVSGGGKTTIAGLVASSLPNAVLFRFDDFDDSNVYPDDFCGADVYDFDCPGMADAVRKAIEVNSVSHIVLDFPFGRDHHRFKNDIHLSVFIDTPLDVAMARRIVRDYCADTGSSGEERLQDLKKELTRYLAKSRRAYVAHLRHKENCDLVLDGCSAPDTLCEQILKRIRTTHRS